MISLLRRQSWATVQMATDTVLAEYLDISHKKIYKKIANLDKNYFWQRRTSNIVANQDEYTLMLPSWGVFWQWSIEKIWIKYKTTDTYYTNVILRTWDELEYDASVYAKEQPEESPFAIISDKSIFIFPTPKTNIAWGLKLEGSRKPYTIDATSPESAFLCPTEYHHVIVLWALPFAIRERSQEGETNNATNDYDKELKEMLYDISSRETSSIRGEQKDLSYLE